MSPSVLFPDARIEPSSFRVKVAPLFGLHLRRPEYPPTSWIAHFRACQEQLRELSGHQVVFRVRLQRSARKVLETFQTHGSPTQPDRRPQVVERTRRAVLPPPNFPSRPATSRPRRLPSFSDTVARKPGKRVKPLWPCGGSWSCWPGPGPDSLGAGPSPSGPRSLPSSALGRPSSASSDTAGCPAPPRWTSHP